MLRSMHEVLGYRLRTTEPFGTVDDFLFDDRDWTIRYVVATTDEILNYRRVLLSPEAMGDPDATTGLLPTRLTTEQVKTSPPLSEDAPVSRQYEKRLFRHYGWMPYWNPPMAPGTPHLAEPQPSVADLDRAPEEGRSEPEYDPHLRSLREMEGYSVDASDGHIGHIEDLIADTSGIGWRVAYFVIDTRDWLPGGRKVMANPKSIARISFGERTIRLGQSKQEAERAPTYDPAAPVNREYEIALYDFQGRPAHWV